MTVQEIIAIIPRDNIQVGIETFVNTQYGDYSTSLGKFRIDYHFNHQTRKKDRFLDCNEKIGNATVTKIDFIDEMYLKLAI